MSNFSLKYFRKWHRIRENCENFDPQNISTIRTVVHTCEHTVTVVLVDSFIYYVLVYNRFLDLFTVMSGSGTLSQMPNQMGQKPHRS